MSPFVLVILFTANFGTTAVSIDMPSEAVCQRELKAIAGKERLGPDLFSSGPAYAARCVDRREANGHG